jgi:hypothetical protein
LRPNRLPAPSPRPPRVYAIFVFWSLQARASKNTVDTFEY